LFFYDFVAENVFICSQAELLIADAESVGYVVPAELKSRAKAVRKAHRISKPKSEASVEL
jgi:hypothetical protein